MSNTGKNRLLRQLEAYGPLAVQTLADIMNNGTPREKLMASQDILNRLAATRKTETTTTSDMPARFVAMALAGLFQTLGGRNVDLAALEGNIESAQMRQVANDDNDESSDFDSDSEDATYEYIGPRDELAGVDKRDAQVLQQKILGISSDVSDNHIYADSDKAARAKLPSGMLDAIKKDY